MFTHNFYTTKEIFAADRANPSNGIEIIAFVPSQIESLNIKMIWDKEEIDKSNDFGFTENTGYLVRLYLNTGTAKSSGSFLYIGNEKISKFCEFKDGLYFKIYNPKHLIAFSGKDIYLVSEYELPRASSFPSEKDKINQFPIFTKDNFHLILGAEPTRTFNCPVK